MAQRVRIIKGEKSREVFDEGMVKIYTPGLADANFFLVYIFQTYKIML